MQCQCLSLENMLSLLKQFWAIKPPFLYFGAQFPLDFWAVSPLSIARPHGFGKYGYFELFFELIIFPQVLKYWLYRPILTSGNPKFFFLLLEFFNLGLRSSNYPLSLVCICLESSSPLFRLLHLQLNKSCSTVHRTFTTSFTIDRGWFFQYHFIILINGYSI